MKKVTFNGKKFEVVENPDISPAEHCTYCDFREMCDDYVKLNDWFPCGATFHANKVYLKQI